MNMVALITQDSWGRIEYKLVTPLVHLWVVDGYEDLSVLTENEVRGILSTMWEENQSELKLHDRDKHNFIERLSKIDDNDERADDALGKSFDSLTKLFEYVAKNNINIIHDFVSI